MTKLLQVAGVAGLVLLGAVGCSHCCGSKTVSLAAPCANGQCAMPAATSQMMTSGMTGTAMPTTMTTMPVRQSMMPATSMPATGMTMPTGTTTNPALLPQN